MTGKFIRCQKGSSEAHSQAPCGDEENCHAPVVVWRWPLGFVCPSCGDADHSIGQVARLRDDVGQRTVYKCDARRRKASAMGSTISNLTGLPVTTSFRVLDLITQPKRRVSSIEFGRGPARRRRPTPNWWLKMASHAT